MGWMVCLLLRHVSIITRGNISVQSVRASPNVQSLLSALAMDAFSPCTPPPQTSVSEPSSPKQTPDKKTVDDKRWIRAHARDMEIQYRRWLASVQSKGEPSERVRYMTSSELASQELCPSSSSNTPVFHHERGSAETMIFARKYPHLMPRGHAEMEEFERRVWFLGVSFLQALEFRRRSRDAGGVWP